MSLIPFPQPTKKEQEDFESWYTNHRKVCKFEDTLAGGSLCFMLIPSSIGWSYKFECGCGEIHDFTDYDNL